MSRAFVAGATGYTGREVVRRLVEQGMSTVAHVRPESPRLEQWRRGFVALGASVEATAWEERAMAESLRRLQPTLIFALLGTTRARGRAARRKGGPLETYESVDYGLTMLLLRAVKSSAPAARFIYLSSIGAGSRSANPYLEARRRAEEEIRQSGVSYVIARPSFITGPGRDETRPLERIGAVVIDGALVVAGFLGARRLRERYGSTTNVILARALVRLAFDAAAVNTIVESDGLRI
ncbi:MAG: NAD(P)H-binding protein [Gemmatimonadetes bacterium]|nr:NAD(P)H-binding protein [Gemmatimonadota bacterium]